MLSLKTQALLVFIVDTPAAFPHPYAALSCAIAYSALRRGLHLSCFQLTSQQGQRL